jgi:hypothetical protein
MPAQLRSDPVWYQDVGVLFRRYDEFFPARDQSAAERVNSMVRLLAYCTAAVYLFGGKPRYLAFGVMAIAVVTAAYMRPPRRACHAGGAGGPQGPDDDEGHDHSDHETRGDRHQTRHVLRASRRCVQSTPDNPFANFLPSDARNRESSCKYDDHADLVERNFAQGLVKNVYDVYDRENGRRQFYTMPVTASLPDTVAFAEWCYGSRGRPSCKEDGSACTGFEGGHSRGGRR